MKRNKIKNIIVLASIALLPAVTFTACKNDKVAAPITPVSTTGVVTAFAGSGAFGSGNGTGTAATFSYPNGLAFDAAGSIYVADQGNNQIRKITSAGVVSTVSGTLLSGSGNATALGAVASYNGPTAVAVDATGNVYVADFGNNQIRKIVTAAGATAGTVTTVAGATGTGTTNGAGTTARFNGPAGIAIDALGNLYVADYGNNLIRKITALGVVSTVAGSGAGNADGLGTAAKFNGPRSIAIDAAGILYVADANNNIIRKIDVAGNVTTLAGSGKTSNTDGAGTAAAFNHPSGISVDAAGNVYVADAANNLVRKITTTGTVSSVAGSGYISLVTPFNGPSAVLADAAGNVYVSNTFGNMIQKVKVQ